MKGVNFYGTRSEFIVSGSDCGHIFLWDKGTESVLQLLKGDEAGVVSGNIPLLQGLAPIIGHCGSELRQ